MYTRNFFKIKTSHDCHSFHIIYKYIYALSHMYVSCIFQSYVCVLKNTFSCNLFFIKFVCCFCSFVFKYKLILFLSLSIYKKIKQIKQPIYRHLVHYSWLQLAIPYQVVNLHRSLLNMQ